MDTELKKLLFIGSLLFCGVLRAEGPLFKSSFTYTQQEFDNVYGDLRKVAAAQILTTDTSGQILTGQGNGKTPIWTSTTTLSFGKLVNVQMFTSVTSSATTPSAFVPTALTGTITPQSTSNKILVLVFSNMQSGGAGLSMQATIERDGSNLLASSGQADCQSTNRVPASLGYLDSPASTALLNYTIYMKCASGTCTWGATGTQVLILAELSQ